LEVLEATQTPILEGLETKVMELGLSTAEMSPSLQMLLRNFAKVNETVEAMEQFQKANKGVEDEKVQLWHGTPF
jgi:uncharacterized coiled-coil protein SlyX